MQDLEPSKLDFLTKCYMKEDLAPVLDKLIVEDRAFNRPFAILLIDIDHFKACNDKYGHLHGDAILKFFSSSLRLSLEEVRSSIFRIGGDEFVILFPGMNAAEAFKVAQFLRFTLKHRPLLMSGKLFNITFSGGIATSHDGVTVDEIVAAADKAMYVSKKHGRGRTTVYERISLTRIAHLTQRAIVIFGLSVILTVLLFYSIQLYFPDSPISPVRMMQDSIFAAKGAQGAVTVYLKSGRTLKGYIVKEYPDRIDLLVSLGTGTGSVTVNRAVIKAVVRGK